LLAGFVSAAGAWTLFGAQRKSRKLGAPLRPRQGDARGAV